MKRIISVLTIALAGLTLTACPDPNTPSPSSTPSVSQSSNPSSNPSSTPTTNPIDTPATTQTSQPTTAPTTPVASTPAVISSTPFPAANSAPIADGYRLNVDGKVFPASLNNIQNERYESKDNQPGYLRLSTLGYETLGDADNEYSFMLTLTTANAFSLGSNFNETDYSKVSLQLRRKDKKTGLTYNYFGETIPGGNKQIPMANNAAEIAGKLSSVAFSSDGQDKRYKGFVDTLVAVDPNQKGIREFPPLRVKIEFNQILKDKIYSNPS